MSLPILQEKHNPDIRRATFLAGNCSVNEFSLATHLHDTSRYSSRANKWTLIGRGLDFVKWSPRCLGMVKYDLREIKIVTRHKSRGSSKIMSTQFCLMDLQSESNIIWHHNVLTRFNHSVCVVNTINRNFCSVLVEISLLLCARHK